MSARRLLAHAGGFSWDETLFLVAPIVIFGLLLAAAKRKAASEEQEAGDDAEDRERRPL